MTLPEQLQEPQDRRCPKCQSVVPAKAVVCPVCHCDIEEKTPEQKKRESLVEFARFAKDWIGFPAAIVTAIAALIIPAKNNALALFHQDGARLTMDLVRPDVLNVGMDDTPVAEQPNEISVHIPFLRYTLINNGVSPASIRPELTCSTVENSDEVTGNFYFLDLRTSKKVLDDIKLSPGESVFVNVTLRDSGRKVDGYGSTKESDTCELRYSDKYGSQTLVVRRKDGDLNPMSIGGADDSRTALRERYCPNMTRGLRFAHDPIDCLDEAHLFAIEPVYLWENALQRALTQVSEFRQLTQSGRTPGLILTGCQEDNCAQKTQEMLSALHLFTPSLTVWLCPPEKPEISSEKKIDFNRDCKSYDFPIPNPQSPSLDAEGRQITRDRRPR
ncbi:MAG: hypothetical protein EOR72_31350 [Mesorhizobium sp.]|uniref:hypothetical protein n=1 Tax=Mesorhizobium sp. TaxID=1871066 RepID=UPI000FE518D3|nr:hypothetical protein [Mesorhizobium sp.]RWM06668.1 MAG: hypothetical protein EOR72_31350 [Mesorhizobium sp.]